MYTSLWSAIKEIALDTLQLLPVAAFVFISSTPSQALAFAEYVELSHQPLIFERDPTISERAVVGIEVFPRARTAGQLLNSRASRIPTAASHVYEGMAVRVLATAYSSTADQTDGNPFVTASGTTVMPGTMAANFLPIGTRVRVGDTIYTVLDRMNSRYNGKYIIDLWMPSRTEAIQFGVRVVEMEVVSLP